MLISAGANVFNLANNYGMTPYYLFPEKLKEYLQIDEVTKTIGILQGKLTKSAKK